LPGGEPRDAAVVGTFVGEIVRAAREGVDGGEVVAQATRQEPRADGEVLVVPAGDPRAVRVGGRQARRIDAGSSARRDSRRHAASTPGRRYSRRWSPRPANTNSPVKWAGGSPPASPAPTSRSYASTSTNVRSASMRPTPASATVSTASPTIPVQNSAQQPLPEEKSPIRLPASADPSASSSAARQR